MSCVTNILIKHLIISINRFPKAFTMKKFKDAEMFKGECDEQLYTPSTWSVIDVS